MVNLSYKERITLWLFLLVPFVCLLSGYSKFYFIPHLDVYINLLCLFFWIFYGRGLLDTSKTVPILIYSLSCVWVICTPLGAHGERPFVKLVYEFIFAVSFLYLKPEYRFWIYDKFIKILAVIFCLGIIEYVLAMLGITHFWGLLHRQVSSGILPFYQGTFCIFPSYYGHSVFRFQSLTEEPGVVGTLCAFILFTIDREKYKKEFYIFCLAGILSLSLAFYLLLLFGLLGKIKAMKLKFLLVSVLLASSVYFVFENAINERIVNRVNVDNLNEIDNRSSIMFQKIFNQFLLSNDVSWGIGNRTFYSKDYGSNAGVKKMIYQYGFIAIFILFFSYSYIFLKFNGVRYSTLLVLLAIWLSFYQRTDWNFSPNIIIFFSYSLAHINNLRFNK